MNDILSQDNMKILSSEWGLSTASVSEHSLADLTLSSCFQFVKSKMYMKRDMCVIANDADRRQLCVALYEYTHRVVSLSDADVAFVDQYDCSQRRHVQSSCNPLASSGALVYI